MELQKCIESLKAKGAGDIVEFGTVSGAVSDKAISEIASSDKAVSEAIENEGILEVQKEISIIQTKIDDTQDSA